jgi:hypothetical protein
MHSRVQLCVVPDMYIATLDSQAIEVWLLYIVWLGTFTSSLSSKPQDITLGQGNWHCSSFGDAAVTVTFPYLPSYAKGRR